MERQGLTMLEEHEHLIRNDILPRLGEVEKNQEDFRAQQLQFKNDLSLLTSAQKSLELTVLKDGQATRELLNKFVDHFFKKEDTEIQVKERVTIKQLDTKEKIIIGVVGAICGTGGLAGIIAAFQIFIK